MPDFPEPGIQFKDLTPLLADAHGLAAVTDALADIAKGADLVAGVDARGFLLGGCRRHQAGHGRAGGPQGRQAAAAGAQRDLRPRVRHGHAGDPGRRHRARRARRSSIIDDVLATGGTVAATARLLRHAGATVTGAAVVLELAALGGRDVLKPLPVSSLHTV